MVPLSHNSATSASAIAQPERLSETIEVARQYVARGWPVLLLKGKKPFRGSSGAHDATVDAETVRSQLLAHPNANIGIALPRLLVVDVDLKQDSLAWLARNRDQLRGFTLTCRTGGGGWHFYFVLPPGKLRGQLCHGVDLRRGAGHYVVAPPSIHPVSGRAYRWIESWPSEPQGMPEWLLNQCRRAAAAALPFRRTTAPACGNGELFERAKRYLGQCAPAISGAGGHSTTFITALKLVTNFPELSDAELWNLLLEYNQRCIPPWSESELRHKLVEALNRHERIAF